ncbi:ftsK/SpoIIIE family protein [Mycobacterium xenopi 4042]|uniref:FtsK/SpoIIIE family protein n=1 Tax=Mycobacterium xenopi 4042 TaxID=1299334 RepID=X8AMF8_MYCXE|nr:ftsK/SpoIIIE family protein [Mycobacterium xenopi 4042]
MELGTVVIDGTATPSAQVRIPLATVNRHGLVAGATGTGKTKTLQLIAEQLSAAGVPVLMADVKGDLSGLARPGSPTTRSLLARGTPVTIGRQRLSRWSSCRWAPPASVCRCARPSPVSGPSCYRKCWGSTLLRNPHWG